MYGSPLSGLRLTEDWWVPRNQVFVVSDPGGPGSLKPTMVAHPSTVMAMMHNGTPLFTRHMLGAREGERDKRKQAKQSATKVTYRSY